MQDANYWAFGCSEITIELTCCKYPYASELLQIWRDNKNSLIEYLKLANTGLRGVISYEDGEPAQNISIQIDQREPIFKTNRNGEYFKLLTPGSYNLRLKLNCQDIYTTRIQIQDPTYSEVNITIPNKFKEESKSIGLSKYPTFCQTKLTSCPNNEFRQLMGINSPNKSSISIRFSLSLFFVLLVSNRFLTEYY